MLMNSGEYLQTIEQVKQEIRTAQYRAAVQVNCELLRLYHSIGSVINAHKVWGSKFVENLAADIKLSFPEMKGYSVRNLKYMAKFAARFSTDEIVQAPLAQIRSKSRRHISGMRNRPQKTAGRAMSSFIRSRVDYTSGRHLLKRYPISSCVCRLRRVSLRSRP